jgi:REP element-mobilizing transposase RayT
MKFNPEKHHRRSIRLRGYDYSKTGAYFVTICTRNRECWLGEIVDGAMVLNDIGRIVQSVWEGLPDCFPTIALDAFVIMPNHIHGIIIVGAQFIAPSFQTTPHSHAVFNNIASNDKPASVLFDQGVMNHAPTLGKIVRTFKAASVRQIRKNNRAYFAWQRNYYEHISRDEDELDRTREYILQNPSRWAEDENNPALLEKGN